MPNLYIITGSNGAGKSSLGSEYVPENLKKNIFDGDKVFMEKRKELWKNGVKSPKENIKLAGEYVNFTFENLVENAIKNFEDFAYEGHFTNDETWKIPQKFKDSGYEINLIFFGLTNTNLSEIRVIGRAKEGGHYVEPITIASNFYGNLEKLDIYFPIFDSIIIYDTSTTEHIGIVEIQNGKVTNSIEISKIPNWFKENLPSIYGLIL